MDVTEQSQKIKKLQIQIFLLVFAGVFIAFLLDAYIGLSDNQFSVFFIQGEDYMADLFNVIVYSKNRDPYHSEMNGMGEKAYFPLTYLICYFLARIMHMENYDDEYDGTVQSLGSMPIVIGVYVVCILVFSVLFQLYSMIQAGQFTKLALTIVMMLSSVMLFSYERANLILLALFGMILFINTYDSDSLVLRECGYLGLALAGALKGYPAILGLLLIYRHEWKGALRLMIYGVLFAFAPFLLLHGGLSNIPIWRENLKINTELYQFSTTPKLGYLYFISLLSEDLDWQLSMESICKPVIILLCGLGIFSSYFQTKKWLKLCTLVCIILVYPSNCGFYCMLYMLPIMILYFNEESKTKRELVYLPIFLMFLCPYQLIYYEVNYTLVFVNVALFVLFGLCLLENILCIHQLIRNKEIWQYIKTGGVQAIK